MAEYATLARPYAEALFKLATEADNCDHWHDFLALLDVIMQDKTITALYANPKFVAEKRISLLLELCEEQQLSLGQIEKNFLHVLADNQRFLLLPEIYTQFHTLQTESTGALNVELISTYAVKVNQKASLIQALEQRFNKKIQLNVSIDRALLGGWIIRANGQMIDLSARGRLQQLASNL